MDLPPKPSRAIPGSLLLSPLSARNKPKASLVFDPKSQQWRSQQQDWYERVPPPPSVPLVHAIWRVRPGAKKAPVSTIEPTDVVLCLWGCMRRPL
eukprot:6473244-Amphidinium_carterae.1